MVVLLSFHKRDGTLETRMETEDSSLTFTIHQICWVDRSNMMLIYQMLAVDAILHCIWCRCQGSTLTEHQIHRREETTTVMQTKLVVYGVQNWISWKPTCMHGAQHLTNAQIRKGSTSQAVIELDAENRSKTFPFTAWVQVDTTESTLGCNSMLKLIST